MSEHVPEEYINGWFGKHILDIDEKAGYADHVLGCDSCRERLKESLAIAKRFYGKKIKDPIRRRMNFGNLKVLDREIYLVGYMLDNDWNHYKSVRALREDIIETLLGDK